MKNMNAFYEASREALSKNNPQFLTLGVWTKRDG